LIFAPWPAHWANWAKAIISAYLVASHKDISLVNFSTSSLRLLSGDGNADETDERNVDVAELFQ
jgi:hypothetical protein